MSEDKKETIKKEKIRFLVFFWEFVLFSLTLFLGIITAKRISHILEVQKVSLSPISPIQFIFYFIVGTLLILFLIFFVKSKPKKGKIFKLLFVFSVFWGGLVVLNLWFNEIFPQTGGLLAFAIILFLIFLWFKKSNVFIHNLCIILAISGAGAVIGLRLNPETMVLLLIIFSVYDFLAVYKTRHMVKMAKEMIGYGSALALIIPQNFQGFRKKIEEISPGGKFLVLGGGDIAFPLLFSVSFVPQSLTYALVVAFFSLIGLFVTFLIFIKQRKKRPIPALPPIALFSIIGFLFTKTLIF